MKITIQGLSLDVDYEYTPPEINNWGHPDDRFPDVEEELEITSVCHKQEDIFLLLSDDAVKEIENIILNDIHQYKLDCELSV